MKNGCFAVMLMGVVAMAQAQEATLTNQLVVNKPGAAVTVGESQVYFLADKMKWSDIDFSPMWVNPPRAVSMEKPKGWSIKVRSDERWGRYRMIVEVPKGADLYGMGEVMGPLRRNNTKVALWNTDNYVYTRDGGRRLYQSHPWVMGVREDGSAFGVLADTTWRGTLEATDSEIIFDCEGPVFPVLVMEGKDPLDVLRQLADRTGYMALPPLWSLGNHQCRWSYMNEKEGLDVVKEFRERKLPLDVLWQDIDYMDGYRVFTFSKKAFPDPRAYIEKLHAQSVKSVWMIDPGIKVDPAYATYQSGNEHDVWVKTRDHKTDFIGPVWPGDCKFPDFTRAETRQWWVEQNIAYINQFGLDGIWNDMNEPAVFSAPGQTMPPDNHHRGDANMLPGPHTKYHNVYGLLMLGATRDALLKAKPDKRPFTLTRSNFMGGQRYGATWTGDNASSDAHMKLSIPMSITLGLSGQPFSGPDIGGFGGSCTASLLEDWYSVGVFYPFVRNHAVKGSARQEPWVFGEGTEQVVRTALERRYRLLPYLYTAFRQSSRDGSPVMRPLFFADVKDKSLRAEEEAFMLGSDLIVIPAFAKNPALPKGNWKEIKLLESGEDAKQAKILLRPGAILPLGNLVQSTEEPMLEALTLLINPDSNGNASGTLYEDAGDGFGYQQGDYRLTTFTYSTEKGLATRAEGNRPSAVKRVIVHSVSEGNAQ